MTRRISLGCSWPSARAVDGPPLLRATRRISPTASSSPWYANGVHQLRIHRRGYRVGPPVSQRLARRGSAIPVLLTRDETLASLLGLFAVHGFVLDLLCLTDLDLDRHSSISFPANAREAPPCQLALEFSLPRRGTEGWPDALHTDVTDTSATIVRDTTGRQDTCTLDARSLQSGGHVSSQTTASRATTLPTRREWRELQHGQQGQQGGGRQNGGKREIACQPSAD